MFASASRTTLRGLSRTSAASFSTTAPSYRLAKGVVVELLHDVPGLGHKFDRVSVSRGRMLNELMPHRLARLIPWKQGAQRATVFIRGPTRGGPSYDRLLHAPGEGDEAAAAAQAVPTPDELLVKIHSVPSSLRFARRTISPSTPALHGSLTVSDVHDVLLKEYGLSGHEVDVKWVSEEDGARMKELGTRDAVVVVRGYGKEEVPVAVEVVRQE